MAAYRAVLSIDPTAAVARHMVAALTGVTTAAAPREYVTNLFDGYAHRYERHLVDVLGYRNPALMRRMLAGARPGNCRFRRALDLGCGTGLVGAASAEFNNINLVQSAATTLSVLSTVDGSTITITSQALDTTSLAVNTLDLTDSAGAASALTLVSTAITNAANKLGNLGSSAFRVQAQSQFTGQLSDILEVEVGNLVDADLTEEAARLTSLQIQEQIAIQGLAIANASPRSLVALFSVLQ